jgi:hypothetical protein
MRWNLSGVLDGIAVGNHVFIRVTVPTLVINSGDRTVTEFFFAWG